MTVSRRASLVTAALVAALTLGCTEPGLNDTTAGSDGSDGPVSPDGSGAGTDGLAAAGGTDESLAAAATPEHRELAAQLRALIATVEATRDRLTGAAEATDTAAARTAATASLAMLLGDPDRSDTRPGLLPTVEPDRSTSGSHDLLTTTLALARDAGGPLGRSTLDLLRDTIAGDLGAWERDPAGVIAHIEATVADAQDLDELDAAVLSLSGDATRALAWTLLATRATSGSEIRTYADRGSAHLTIVLTALSQLELGSEQLDGRAETETGVDP